MSMNLTELKGLVELATPGPWRVETQTLDSLDYDTDEPQVYVVHPGTVCTDTVIAMMGETASLTTSQKQANAAIIVAAVNALPALISALEAAEARNATLAAGCAELVPALDKCADALAHFTHSRSTDDKHVVARNALRCARILLHGDAGRCALQDGEAS